MKIIKYFEVILPLLFTIITVSTLVIPAARNIDNPNFWVDESGQFWIAQGLNHFSEPYSKTNGITSVIQQNARYNFDPGGFSLLLHFWTRFGTNPTWLRLLPYLFFLMSAFALGYNAWLWTKSPLIALVAAQTILYSATIVHFGFELRAYSMEACGVAVLALLLTLLTKYNTKALYITAGFALAFFLTSRYSFSAFTIAFTIVCTIHFIRTKSIGLSRLLMICAPGLLCGILIYFFTLRYQSPSLTPPPYVQDILFKGNNSQAILSIIGDNLFSRKALPKTFFCIILPTLFFGFKHLRLQLQPLFYFFLYLILADLVLILFSIKGMYPWYFSNRFGISLQMVSTFTLVASACVIYDMIKNKITGNRFNYVLYITIMTSISILWLYKSTYRKFYPRDTLYTLLSAMPQEQLEKASFLATEKASPTIRYLFEYGPMKNSPAYPTHFTFDSSGTIGCDYMFHLSEKPVQYILFSNWLQPTIDAYLKRCDIPFRRYSQGEVSQI